MPVTERQRAANRANALKSTGPRTAEGKRRASRNARTHGLTMTPEPALVLDFFRVILDDATAELAPVEHDPVRRAARHLAEAEVRLQHATRFEEWALSGLKRFREEDERQAEIVRNADRSDPWMREALAFLERGLGDRTASFERNVRRMARYRARAERRRRTALRRWIEARDNQSARET